VNDLFNAVRYGSWDHIIYIVEQDKHLVEKLGIIDSFHCSHILIVPTEDGEGHTCIHWAAKRGNYEILKYLHDAGAPLDQASLTDPRMMPIHWAASDGKINALKFFLDYRQDINAQDGNGCTPVVISTQYNQINAAIFLIKVIFK
jgi:ankyrin repeat protein